MLDNCLRFVSGYSQETPGECLLSHHPLKGMRQRHNSPETNNTTQGQPKNIIAGLQARDRVNRRDHQPMLAESCRRMDAGCRDARADRKSKQTRAPFPKPVIKPQELQTKACHPHPGTSQADAQFQRSITAIDNTNTQGTK
jgi:hypothetical protein